MSAKQLFGKIMEHTVARLQTTLISQPERPGRAVANKSSLGATRLAQCKRETKGKQTGEGRGERAGQKRARDDTEQAITAISSAFALDGHAREGKDTPALAGATSHKPTQS